MAVCGNEETRHGIVLAKNEEAEKYGIITAETVYSAKKKCPMLVVSEPHREEYVKFSNRVNEIYARYTDLIEPFGIDESWLDVTASKRLYGNGTEIAERIREDVKREIGITVSIGVSFNKVYAKIGSDYKKPDAVTIINELNYKTIVYPLPVSDLLFVGKKTSEELSRMGIKTIGALAETSESVLKMKFGKLGELLFAYAKGEDRSPVIPLNKKEDTKSVGSGYTFKRNLIGNAECKAGIDFLAEDVGKRLRKLGMKCSTVQLTIKDQYLRVIQRQMQMDPPTDISREISECAMNILRKEWSEQKPIRMLTVTAQNLIHKENVIEQLSFFSNSKNEDRNKTRKKEETVDMIRQKYGNTSIICGSYLDDTIGIAKPKK